MALEKWLPFSPLVFQSLRLVLVAAIVVLWSRPVLSLRPSLPLASVAVGLGVFAIWIGPDLLFGYRHHWLFENAVTGRAASTLPPVLHHDPRFLAIRLLTTAALVPIIEELFWRGWLMRWLIDSRDFQKLPIGTYQPLAFWLVAALFGTEHGPYWDVGLLAGVTYNWWLIRTRNLADCILAHAVTNTILAFYVLTAHQWQYWL